MNTATSFELAILLKEKEINIPSDNYWVETKEHVLDIPRSGNEIFPAQKSRILNYRPIENYHKIHCTAPTIADVIMWLYKNLHIWIYSYQPNETGYWAHNLDNKAKYDSPEEAYEAGILQYLTNI